MQTHTINGSGKVLGRLASEVAALLAGKTSPDFAPNRTPDIRVIVTHAGKVLVTGKKFSAKRYFRHSGYPGGAKFISFRQAFERDPRRVVEQAVSGMLPKNRLRASRMKRLSVYRDEPVTSNQ